MILDYNRLPAYQEARQRDQANKDREFLGCGHFISGVKIRPMSLRDMQILLELRSPFLYRRWPTTRELVFFLWILSPELEKWHDETGWRKAWLWCSRWQVLNMEYWISVAHGRRCRRLLKLGALEKQMRQPGFKLPENSHFAQTVKACFDYVDVMFRDGPTGPSGAESYYSHLAGFCDTIRSEYKCQESEVMQMPLPKLWQVLRAIQKRKDPKTSWPSPECEKVRRAVRKAINSGRFTMEDFITGKPKWDGTQWN